MSSGDTGDRPRSWRDIGGGGTPVPPRAFSAAGIGLPHPTPTARFGATDLGVAVRSPVGGRPGAFAPRHPAYRTAAPTVPIPASRPCFIARRTPPYRVQPEFGDSAALPSDWLLHYRRRVARCAEPLRRPSRAYQQRRGNCTGRRRAHLPAGAGVVGPSGSPRHAEEASHTSARKYRARAFGAGRLQEPTAGDWQGAGVTGTPPMLHFLAGRAHL